MIVGKYIHFIMKKTLKNSLSATRNPTKKALCEKCNSVSEQTPLSLSVSLSLSLAPKRRVQRTQLAIGKYLVIASCFTGETEARLGLAR